MNYSEKLKDPRWQKIRLKVLEDDDFACQLCFDVQSTLHVHHKIYVFGQDPWDYKRDELITLCEDCHQKEKELKEKNKKKLQYLIDTTFSQAIQDQIINALENYDFQYSEEVAGGLIADLIKSAELQEILFNITCLKNKKNSEKN